MGPTRSTLYALVSVVFLVLLGACYVAWKRGDGINEERYTDDAPPKPLADAEVNIIIVRAFSNGVRRFPTSEELVAAAQWARDTLPERDLADKAALKERFDAYVREQVAGQGSKQASNGGEPDGKKDGKKDDKKDEEPTKPAGDDAAPNPAQPSFAPAAFSEGYDNTVHIGLSRKDVNTMRNKVGTVLSSLDAADTAMKLVTRDETTVVPIPVNLQDLQRLRSQVDNLSSQLRSLESRASAQED